MKFPYSPLLVPLLTLPLSLACSPSASLESIDAHEEALAPPEDALVAQFADFSREFVELGRDIAFDVGVAPFGPMGTEDLGTASLVVNFENNDGVYTGLFSIQKGPNWSLPSNLGFDVYAGTNVPGAGRSAKPEAGDTFTKLGTFSSGGASFTGLGVNLKNIPRIDFLVFTRVGVLPATRTVAIGALTLFERRFFASKFGWTMPTATGVASAVVPTTDPLVQAGSEVFFKQTFGGNGRTCGTCHRAENNFTIDPAFVATLPSSDPLLKAARDVPGLEGANPSQPSAQISGFGLILENLDGFETAPVFRSVQHTLGLGSTTTRPRVPILNDQVLVTPPDEATGWSADGAPGRGTLHDFALGAVVQHLPKDVRRRVGTDFRLPTQEELDALEAFQLSLGRSKDLHVRQLEFFEPAAEAGKNLFNGQGLCFVCHDNAGARSNGPAIFNNVNLDQGVERRPETAALGLAKDAGFGRAPRFSADGTFLGFGDGEFNVQSLVEAADTAPFFHNNSAPTLEKAIEHYTTAAFESGPAGFADGVRPTLDAAQVQDVGAFLRLLNAAQNVQDVEKRLVFVRDHAGAAANTNLLRLALEDVNDALADLQQGSRALAPNSKHALVTLKSIVESAIAQAPSMQPSYAGAGVSWCQAFFDLTFRANPASDFR